jgi:hypothetical protein
MRQTRELVKRTIMSLEFLRKRIIMFQYRTLINVIPKVRMRNFGGLKASMVKDGVIEIVTRMQVVRICRPRGFSFDSWTE